VNFAMQPKSKKLGLKTIGNRNKNLTHHEASLPVV